MTQPAPSDRVLARLMDLHPKKIDLSLGRMERLLARLGHPEQAIPPVIHVAGTNGKGSTVAYMRAILEASGLRVHVYTSPHLVRFAERIRLAGTLVSDDALTALLEDCEHANGPDPITFFEVTTAAALLGFARTPADVVLLEVGLGGRLDATNVINEPLVTAITPVSLDHQEFLGATLPLIATEKAGIAKAGRPLVIGAQDPDALTAILDQAGAVDAIPLVYGYDWQLDGQDYRDWRGTQTLPTPALNGPHQIENAALAVACLRAQDRFAISEEAIHQGLTKVVWPARLQDISAAAGRPSVWLDGGHNPAGAATIAAALSVDPKPTTLILGMLANKDLDRYLALVAPHIHKLWAVPIPGETAHDPATIRDCAASHNMSADMAPSWQHALANTDGSDRVVICGSLYLAGQVLDDLKLYPQ